MKKVFLGLAFTFAFIFVCSFAALWRDGYTPMGSVSGAAIGTVWILGMLFIWFVGFLIKDAWDARRRSSFWQAFCHNLWRLRNGR